jgi:hypothetical membrane protein
MNLIRFSIFYFVAVIILAHFFTPPQYRWTQNTISDLAAQGMIYQWIMQVGFIGFGLLLNLGFLLKFIAAGKISYPDIFIMLYGLCILLTGFFSAAPFLEGVKFSVQEGNLHSLFATAAGICFTIGIFLRLITAPTLAERWQYGIFLLLVTLTSLSLGFAENGIIPVGKGIVQRSLYLVSFIWLFLSQA